MVNRFVFPQLMLTSILIPTTEASEAELQLTFVTLT